MMYGNTSGSTNKRCSCTVLPYINYNVVCINNLLYGSTEILPELLPEVPYAIHICTVLYVAMYMYI